MLSTSHPCTNLVLVSAACFDFLRITIGMVTLLIIRLDIFLKKYLSNVMSLSHCSVFLLNFKLI